MSKVYASKKLNYGRVEKFTEPAELKNDPIYADANFENVFNSGDSLQENEDDNSGDFFNEGKKEELILFDDNNAAEKNKKKTDTVPVSKDPKKDEVKPKATLNKPDNKKADEKGKGKTANDY